MYSAVVSIISFASLRRRGDPGRLVCDKVGDLHSEIRRDNKGPSMNSVTRDTQIFVI